MANNFEGKKYLDLAGLGKFWELVKPMIDAKVAQSAYDTKMSSLDASIKDIDEKYKAADLAHTNEDARLAGLISAMDAAYKAADLELDGKIATKVETEAYTAKVGELEGKIAEKVAQSAYDKKIAALEAADETFATKDEVADEVEALEGKIAEKVAQSAYDTKVGEIENAISGVDGRLTTAEGEIDTLQEAVSKMASDSTVSDIQSRLTVLEGGEGSADKGKSVREIANEELAAQLIPENAAESLDELKEIAAWIQAHPGDAATMNEAIQANAKAVADEKTRAEGEEAKIRGEFAAADATLKSDLQGEFAAADATLKSELEGKIAEKVAQSDYDKKVGEIEAAIALKADKTALEGAVETLEGAIALKADSATLTSEAERLGGLINGVDGRLTTAEGKVSTLEGEVSALKGSSATFATVKYVDAQDLAVYNSISSIELTAITNLVNGVQA